MIWVEFNDLQNIFSITPVNKIQTEISKQLNHRVLKQTKQIAHAYSKNKRLFYTVCTVDIKVFRIHLQKSTTFFNDTSDELEDSTPVTLPSPFGLPFPLLHLPLPLPPPPPLLLPLHLPPPSSLPLPLPLPVATRVGPSAVGMLAGGVAW